MKNWTIALFAALLLAFAGGAALAAKPDTYLKKGEAAALEGYDPVSYQSGAPTKGQAQFAAAFKGATYRFSSAANLEKFRAAPQAYAPQYGGYCAWAVANGYTAPGDPLAWKVVNGKLYLNYNATIQKKWEKDIPGFIGKADGNWPKVLAR